ncbi:MAG: heavy-metal-associated domain-containing protein [Spirochaetales bacterium]|jgi:copper chaperone|nr:heavy-metal-associated domain-containing protein [Spirochaetales bacterium]
MKYVFSVPDMSCSHCKLRITEALNKLDSTESVFIDLDEKRVEVESSQNPAALIKAIKQAGYDGFMDENL